MKTRWTLGLGAALLIASACGDDDGGKDKNNPSGDAGQHNDAGMGGNPDGSIPNIDGSVPDGSIVSPDGAIITPGTPKTTAINYAGGTATSSDGKLTLTFPPTYFRRPVNVVITSPLANAPAGAAGTVYGVEPTQESTNRNQVRVALKYTAADLNGGQPQDLQLAVYLDKHWQLVTQKQVLSSTMEITGFTTELGPVALIGGICGACTTTCTAQTCAQGTCMATGNGCSVCRYSCDTDGDGFCLPNLNPPGAQGSDCNENDPNINSQAPELCNGKDDNCDGFVDEGCKTCATDSECTETGTFCNAQTRVCDVCREGCSGAAGSACDYGGSAGLCFAYGKSCVRCVPAADKDGDRSVAGPDTPSVQGGDCDDNNAAVNRNATEVCGNQIDDNCDGTVNENCACTSDATCGQGWNCSNGACQLCNTNCDGCTGTCTAYANGCNRCVQACDTDMDGYCVGAGDCQPNDPAINPGATELCDGVDNNCNGHTDEGCNKCTSDNDCKSVGSEYCNPNGACDFCNTDCSGTTCTLGPQTAPVAGVCVQFGAGCSKCYPTCDTDRDGFCAAPVPSYVDEKRIDCDPASATVHPDAPEICGNMIDDDCDGAIDEDCTLCTASAMCLPVGECSNSK